MKKIKKGLLCMVMLLICCLLPGRDAEAATKYKKLFTFKISDGFVTQSVPVYEYTEDNGNVYVAAKKTLRTLSVYAGAKTANFSISGKTSYYKTNYKSITYKKKVTLTSSRSLTFTLKTKKGVKETMTLKLQRPSMPQISSVKVSSTTFTPGNSKKLTVKLNMKSSVAVQAYYKIKNSSGKVVYQKNLGTRKSTNYTTTWDGKPSKGNKAGLSTSSYVPAGTYKLTGYLQYTVGGKNKYISKTVTIKVKKAAASTTTAANTTTGTSTGTSAFKAVNWNWKIILSGDDTLDFMVEKICQEVLNNNMTEIQRARTLYSWCDKNLTHIYNNINTNTSKSQVENLAASADVAAYAKQVDTQIATGKAAVDWTDGYFGSTNNSGMHKTKIGWLKAGFIQKQGNCLVMSSIYQTLLRHAGIDAYIVENDSSAGHHFWNVVKIGGNYYYTDVDMTTYGTVGISDSSYTYFLRGTNYFYKNALYSTVMKNKSKYSIANKVSAADCPGRI